LEGKLGVEAEDSDCSARSSTRWERTRASAVPRNRRHNGISVRKGIRLSREPSSSRAKCRSALATYAYKAEQLKTARAASTGLLCRPAVSAFRGLWAWHRRAPHPSAAILFLEFMLTDAAAAPAHRDFSGKPKGQVTSGRAISHVLDPAKALDENRKWSKYYARSSPIGRAERAAAMGARVRSTNGQ